MWETVVFLMGSCGGLKVAERSVRNSSPWPCRWISCIGILDHSNLCGADEGLTWRGQNHPSGKVISNHIHHPCWWFRKGGQTNEEDGAQQRYSLRVPVTLPLFLDSNPFHWKFLQEDMGVNLLFSNLSSENGWKPARFTWGTRHTFQQPLYGIICFCSWQTTICSWGQGMAPAQRPWLDQDDSFCLLVWQRESHQPPFHYQQKNPLG